MSERGPWVCQRQSCRGRCKPAMGVLVEQVTTCLCVGLSPCMCVRVSHSEPEREGVREYL